jgi:hypothetical protein
LLATDNVEGMECLRAARSRANLERKARLVGRGPASPLAAAGPAMAQDASNQEVDSMRIRITAEGIAITATLEDSPTTRDFGHARGLVNLGRIDSGIEALERAGPIRATIERVED